MMRRRLFLASAVSAIGLSQTQVGLERAQLGGQALALLETKRRARTDGSR
jgi:hypothetical protein